MTKPEIICQVSSAMSNLTGPTIESGRADPNNSSGRHGFLVFIALVVVVGLMWWSWNYTLPNGKHMDVVGFISLWFRELVIVGFAGAVALLILVVAVVKAVRKLRTGAA